MKQVLIDAYNAIHAIPQLQKHIELSLESARDTLIEYVVSWRRENKFIGNICLVFDGDKDIMQNTTMASGLKCIFYPDSKGGADAYINSVVKKSKNPGSITVVTKDNKDIGKFCRALGAKVVGPDFLLSRPRQDNRGEKNISGFIKSKINEELAKEWGIK
jgi:predicted RNA-binding protein with PIN domain